MGPRIRSPLTRSLSCGGGGGGVGVVKPPTHLGRSGVGVSHLHAQAGGESNPVGSDDGQVVVGTG